MPRTGYLGLKQWTTWSNNTHKEHWFSITSQIVLSKLHFMIPMLKFVFNVKNPILSLTCTVRNAPYAKRMKSWTLRRKYASPDHITPTLPKSKIGTLMEVICLKLTTHSLLVQTPNLTLMASSVYNVNCHCIGTCLPISVRNARAVMDLIWTLKNARRSSRVNWQFYRIQSGYRKT